MRCNLITNISIVKPDSYYKNYTTMQTNNCAKFCTLVLILLCSNHKGSAVLAFKEIHVPCMQVLEDTLPIIPFRSRRPNSYSFLQRFHIASINLLRCFALFHNGTVSLRSGFNSVSRLIESCPSADICFKSLIFILHEVFGYCICEDSLFSTWLTLSVCNLGMILSVLG